MSMIKESFNEGMRKQEMVKSQIKYFIFGFISVGVYDFTSFYGLLMFYLVMIIVDYVIGYYQEGGK